jgi:hypothetical protein
VVLPPSSAQAVDQQITLPSVGDLAITYASLAPWYSSGRGFFSGKTNIEAVALLRQQAAKDPKSISKQVLERYKLQL